MRVLGRVKGVATNRIGIFRYRTRNAWFNAIGKNPYPDGSVGSLFWKIDYGKPLNEEERRTKDEWDDMSRSIARLSESSEGHIFV